MFVIKVDKVIAKLCREEPMTSGSSKTYLAQFYFSPEWDDLQKLAVFRVGDTSVEVVLDKTNRCYIPWEVLTIPRASIEIGVYGSRNGDVSLPTIWVKTKPILEGIKTGIEAQEPSPDIYQQLLEKLQLLDDLSDLVGLKSITLEELEVICNGEQVSG